MPAAPPPARLPELQATAARDRGLDVTFEPREGGRVYETWQDGTEVEWGEVLAWEPPERFVMTWNMTSVGPSPTRRKTAR